MDPGVIQPGNFHLSERYGYKISAEVSGKGLCRFPARRRADGGGYHT